MSNFILTISRRTSMDKTTISTMLIDWFESVLDTSNNAGPHIFRYGIGGKTYEYKNCHLKSVDLFTAQGVALPTTGTLTVGIYNQSMSSDLDYLERVLKAEAEKVGVAKNRIVLKEDEFSAWCDAVRIEGKDKAILLTKILNHIDNVPESEPEQEIYKYTGLLADMGLMVLTEENAPGDVEFVDDLVELAKELLSPVRKWCYKKAKMYQLLGEDK